MGSLYPDVGPKIQALHAQGTKVYIYSSGSREAQRMLMAFSNSGDLRPFISGFFDTTVGPKTTASSYSDIALTLGLDSPHQILFATDSVKVRCARVRGAAVSEGSSDKVRGVRRGCRKSLLRGRRGGRSSLLSGTMPRCRRVWGASTLSRAWTSCPFRAARHPSMEIKAMTSH